MIDIYNVPLFITVASYGFFFCVTVLFGIWVYLKSSRKTTHIMFLALSLAIGVYQISHVFGIISQDPDASRITFTMTLSLIFVACFTIHWIAAVLDRLKEYKGILVTMYTIGIALTGFYMLIPNAYLLRSAPKLYFPNYYVAGDYYWLLILFFIAAFIISMRMLYKTYKMSDPMHRNRLAYYIVAVGIGYPLGSLGFFLAYNINIDPIYATTFNFFIIPLAYGVLRYDIMDIKAAARKTLSYAMFIVGTALFILGSHLGNDVLISAYPTAPGWVVPLLSSLLMVLFAGYMWERSRDLEILKYEFINVVTHKFRTPLTRIKWSSEILRHHAKDDEEEKMAIADVENASDHLVALTDMLLNLRKASDSAFQYEFEQADICNIVNQAVTNVDKLVKDRNLSFTVTCPTEATFASLDRRRMLFAIQIILDNAITYTPKGGLIAISVTKDDTYIYVNVTDSGMGISKDDIPKVFSKFWRSKEAKTTDTEGMGIGLFMARQIVERHDGEILVSSEGLGKGSKFTIRLPDVTE